MDRVLFFFKILKSGLLLVAAIETSFLTFLYSWNYEKMKKSPIIGALRNVFFFFALVGFSSSFLIVTRPIFWVGWECLIFNFLMVFSLLGMIVGLRRFRRYSLLDGKD